MTAKKKNAKKAGPSGGHSPRTRADAHVALPSTSATARSIAYDAASQAGMSQTIASYELPRASAIEASPPTTKAADLRLPLLFSPGPDGVPRLKTSAVSSPAAPAASTTQSVSTDLPSPSLTDRPSQSPTDRPSLSPADRHRRIAAAAFQRACDHGLGRTNPLDDWLWAERHVEASLGSLSAH